MQFWRQKNARVGRAKAGIPPACFRVLPEFASRVRPFSQPWRAARVNPCGDPGHGLNRLGVLLMQVCEEILAVQLQAA